MDFTHVLCTLSFFMALRFMGFRIYKPAVCPVCQINESKARRELWRILNTASSEELKQCMTEFAEKQKKNDESDEEDSDENEGDQSDDEETEEITTVDQSASVEQMIEENQQKNVKSSD